MLYAILAAIILIADQWVKYWTTVNIVLDTGEMPLFPGIVKLVNVHNSGAAFGFLSSSESARWAFIIIAIVFTLLLIILMARRVFHSKFANFCCALAIAGAIGNCIDRFVFGYVVDMFKLEFINFAVFNVADIFLVIACVLFIFYLLFGYNGKEAAEVEKKPKKAKKEKKSKKEKEVEVKEKAPVKEKKARKKGFDFEETEPLDDDLFLSQIDSAFEAENEPKPISAKIPDEDSNIDIRPEDIMFGIKGLDMEETRAEEPEPVIPQPVLENADDIPFIIGNDFMSDFESKAGKKMPEPVKKEIKVEEAPKPQKAPEPEKVPEPAADFDPFDFSLESILEEFK